MRETDDAWRQLSADESSPGGRVVPVQRQNECRGDQVRSVDGQGDRCSG